MIELVILTCLILDFYYLGSLFVIHKNLFYIPYIILQYFISFTWVIQVLGEGKGEGDDGRRSWFRRKRVIISVYFLILFV
jgi:hypothetical protein